MKSSASDLKALIASAYLPRTQSKTNSTLSASKKAEELASKGVSSKCSCPFCVPESKGKTLTEKMQADMYRKYVTMVDQGQNLKLGQILRKKRSKTYVLFREIEFEAQRNLFRRYYFTGEFSKKFQNIFRYLSFAVVMPQVLEKSTILRSNKLIKRRKREEVLRKAIERIPETELEGFNLQKLKEFEGMRSILVEEPSPNTPVLHGLNFTKVRDKRHSLYIPLSCLSFDQEVHEIGEVKDFNERSVITQENVLQISKNASFLQFIDNPEEPAYPPKPPSGRSSEDQRMSRGGEYLFGPESSQNGRVSEKNPISLDDLFNQRHAFAKKSPMMTIYQPPNHHLPTFEVKTEQFGRDVYKSKTENPSVGDKASGQSNSLQTKATSEKDTSQRAKEFPKLSSLIPSELIKDFTLDRQIDIYVNERSGVPSTQERFGLNDPDEPFNGIIYKTNSLKVTPKIKAVQGRLSGQSITSPPADSDMDNQRSQPVSISQDMTLKQNEISKSEPSQSKEMIPIIYSQISGEAEMEAKKSQLPTPTSSQHYSQSQSQSQTQPQSVPHEHPEVKHIPVVRTSVVNKIDFDKLHPPRKIPSLAKPFRPLTSRIDLSLKKLSIKTSLAAPGKQPPQPVDSADTPHESRRISLVAPPAPCMKIKEKSDLSAHKSIDWTISQSQVQEQGASPKFWQENPIDNFVIRRRKPDFDKSVAQSIKDLGRSSAARSRTIFSSRQKVIEGSLTSSVFRDFVQSQETVSLIKSKPDLRVLQKGQKPKVLRSPHETVQGRLSVRDTQGIFKPEFITHIPQGLASAVRKLKTETIEIVDKSEKTDKISSNASQKRPKTNSSISSSRKPTKEAPRMFYGELKSTQSVVLGSASKSTQLKNFLNQKKKV